MNTGPKCLELSGCTWQGSAVSHRRVRGGACISGERVVGIISLRLKEKPSDAVGCKIRSWAWAHSSIQVHARWWRAQTSCHDQRALLQAGRPQRTTSSQKKVKYVGDPLWVTNGKSVSSSVWRQHLRKLCHIVWCTSQPLSMLFLLNHCVEQEAVNKYESLSMHHVSDIQSLYHLGTWVKGSGWFHRSAAVVAQHFSGNRR